MNAVRQQPAHGAGLSGDALKRLAQTWVDGGREAPPSAQDWLALAWAIKDLAYAAWSSDPAATQQAAVAAAAVAAAAPQQLHRAEAGAVAAWLDGVADLTQGRMSEAAQHFDAAALAFAALGQPLRAAQTQVPKMMALSVLGRHAEAAACGEQARQALRAAGDLVTAGKVSQNLGNLHVRCNAYGDALRCYREASVLFARAGDREHSVMADLGAADARAALGQFDEALHLCERARLRATQHAMPVLAALALDSAALIELARGRFRPALTGLEQALERYQALSLPQHQATTEKQLADAYLELRLLPEAQAMYEQALERFADLQMPVEAAWTHVQAARVLTLLERPAEDVQAQLAIAWSLFEAQQVPLGLATVLLARAEQAMAAGHPDDALEDARRAVTAFDAAGAADGHLRAQLTCAQALLACGDSRAARRAFEGAAAQATALGSVAASAQAQAGIGSAAWQAGERPAAEQAFEAAVTSLEWQRAALPDDTLRESFFADQLVAYRGLLRVALVDADARPGDAGARHVLKRLDAFRARVLEDRLRGAASVATDAHGTALRERLDWLYRRALRLREDGDEGGGAWSEIKALEAQLLEHTRRRHFAQADDGAAVARTELDVDVLVAQLGEHDALVEYGALDGELFAVVLTRHGARLERRVADWSAVLEALQALQFQLDALRSGEAPVQRHLPQLTARAVNRLQRMHALVWAPLAPALRDSRRVLVVPHGPLAALPFAALHDGTSHLIESLVFASAASARVALHGLGRPPPSRPSHAVALGDSQRLPHAGPEAVAAARAYGHGLAQVGAAATLEALRDAAPRADVVHLACHGEFRADNPAFSLLHLADGALSVQDVAALGLGRSTVVLGACDSARSHSGVGDEAVGFVRAFMQAGAARVIASLWPVADARSAAPMKLLHEAMAQGVAPAQALREAQRAVLREHPHPFHWAAYTVHGGW